MLPEKTISSRHNPLFKRLREAIREHGEEIVVEGPKAVFDALAGGWKPIAIVVTNKRDDGLLERKGLPVVTFSAELLEALGETKTTQGVIALFERPAHSAEEILARRDTVVIALDAVQDPGNVGTIVRLAAAFDAAGVLLLPGCADPFGPKAIRASVGAILDVPVASTTVRQLLDCGLPLIATAMSGAIGDPPTRGAVLVFGNEGSGVSSELMSASRAIAIPMSSRVESLNVASTAAILLARSFSLRV